MRLEGAVPGRGLSYIDSILRTLDAIADRPDQDAREGHRPHRRVQLVGLHPGLAVWHACRSSAAAFESLLAALAVQRASGRHDVECARGGSAGGVVDVLSRCGRCRPLADPAAAGAASAARGTLAAAAVGAHA